MTMSDTDAYNLLIKELHKVKMNASFNGNPAVTIGLCNRLIKKYKEKIKEVQKV